MAPSPELTARTRSVPPAEEARAVLRLLDYGRGLSDGIDANDVERHGSPTLVGLWSDWAAASGGPPTAGNTPLLGPLNYSNQTIDYRFSAVNPAGSCILSPRCALWHIARRSARPQSPELFRSLCSWKPSRSRIRPAANFDHQPIGVRIRNALLARILAATIAPGDRLVELQLAREFGSSQAPVREALRDLEKAGLVTIRPRRGCFVNDYHATRPARDLRRPRRAGGGGGAPRHAAPPPRRRRR